MIIIINNINYIKKNKYKNDINKIKILYFIIYNSRDNIIIYKCIILK